MRSSERTDKPPAAHVTRKTEGHVPKLTKPLPKPAAPTPLKGHLWKEGYHWLQKYKWRYIAVKDTGVQWWHSEKEEKAGRPARGRLDFAINPCEAGIEKDGKGGKVIILKPSKGQWVEGNFTGAEKGREIRFCCKGSEHAAEKWVEKMRAHIEHGKAWRMRASMVADSFDRKKKEDERSDSFGQKENGDDSDESDSDSDSSAELSSDESENEEEGKGGQDEISDAPRVLLWNIEVASRKSTNVLEYLPAEGLLGTTEEATLNEVWQHLLQSMVEPDKSPKLNDLLCNKPLEEAGPLEKAPLTVVSSGLVDWLLSRKAAWGEVWPDQSVEELAVEWCADYSTRWEFWKRQTLNEWLCDDGSGGDDFTTMLQVRRPTIASTCPTMCLHAADQAHRRRAPRNSDDIVRSCFREESTSSPVAGEHDFFRLLVWDLIVMTLVSKVKDLRKILDFIKADTFTLSGDRVRSIVERVQSSSDIALLLGAPASLLDLQCESVVQLKEDFWEVKSPDTGTIRIFARKRLFDLPRGQGSCCKGAMVYCSLHLRSGSFNGSRSSDVYQAGEEIKGNLHIVACQACEEADLAAEVEALITERTILCGSLWKGSLHDYPTRLSSEDHPKLYRLLTQIDGVHENCGSVCRKLSPLQTRVTKMMTTEVELQDFFFLGDDFLDAEVEGLLSAEDCKTAASLSPALTTFVRSATVCL